MNNQISNLFANMGNSGIVGAENMSAPAAQVDMIGQMENKIYTPFKRLGTTSNNGRTLFTAAPGIPNGDFAYNQAPPVPSSIPITVDFSEEDEDGTATLWDNSGASRLCNVGCCDAAASKGKIYQTTCGSGEKGEIAYEFAADRLCSGEMILKSLRLSLAKPNDSNYGVQQAVSDLASMVIKVLTVNELGLPTYELIFVKDHINQGHQLSSFVDIPLIGNAAVLDKWRHWTWEAKAGVEYQFMFHPAYRR